MKAATLKMAAALAVSLYWRLDQILTLPVTYLLGRPVGIKPSETIIDVRRDIAELGGGDIVAAFAAME